MPNKQKNKRRTSRRLGTSNLQSSIPAAVQPVTQVQSAAPLQPSPNVPAATPQPPKDDVLFFIQNSKEGIEPADVNRLEKTLVNATRKDKLYLVLYTLGGDVYSAVRIMRLLQNHYNEINVLIPDYAYSSGTVMSLGSNKIFMAIKASLGPLDKPMEHFKDGSEMSSLDITKTLTNITSICTSMGKSIYSQLRDEGMHLGKESASKIAFDTAAKLVSPIISQIDPFNLQRGFREAAIGRDYAFDMLCTRMMKDDPWEAIKTSNALVNNYPSHGFCLFREECVDVLKLTVERLEDLQDWIKIKPRYDILKGAYSRYIKIEQL